MISGEKGVDFAHYNTNAIADDVDAVRQALGAERISIVGFSYGTHLHQGARPR